MFVLRAWTKNKGSNVNFFKYVLVKKYKEVNSKLVAMGCSHIGDECCHL